mgnify:CR=1 FL=1|tara:strand:+ start:1125 stop:2573 length:1449 start_codon:yes stop_codon:yes gene_type:complete
MDHGDIAGVRASCDVSTSDAKRIRREDPDNEDVLPRAKRVCSQDDLDAIQALVALSASDATCTRSQGRDADVLVLGPTLPHAAEIKEKDTGFNGGVDAQHKHDAVIADVKKREKSGEISNIHSGRLQDVALVLKECNEAHVVTFHFASAGTNRGNCLLGWCRLEVHNPEQLHARMCEMLQTNTSKAWSDAPKNPTFPVYEQLRRIGVRPTRNSRGPVKSDPGKHDMFYYTQWEFKPDESSKNAYQRMKPGFWKQAKRPTKKSGAEQSNKDQQPESLSPCPEEGRPSAPDTPDAGESNELTLQTPLSPCPEEGRPSAPDAGESNELTLQPPLSLCSQDAWPSHVNEIFNLTNNVSVTDKKMEKMWQLLEVFRGMHDDGVARFEGAQPRSVFGFTEVHVLQRELWDGRMQDLGKTIEFRQSKNPVSSVYEIMMEWCGMKVHPSQKRLGIKSNKSLQQYHYIFDEAHFEETKHNVHRTRQRPRNW